MCLSEPPRKSDGGQRERERKGKITFYHIRRVEKKNPVTTEHAKKAKKKSKKK